MPEFVIDNIIRADDDLLVAGRCSSAFRARIPGRTSWQARCPCQVFLNQQTGAEGVFKFMIATQTAGPEPVTLEADFGDHSKVVDIGEGRGDSRIPADISEYAGYNWWNILNSLRRFGNLWHRFLQSLDRDLIENLDFELLRETERNFYFRIKKLLAKSDLSGAKIDLDINDALNLKLKGELRSDTEAIYIDLDNTNLLTLTRRSEGNSADWHFEHVLRIKKERYSSCCPALVIRDDRRNVIFFRFFEVGDYIAPDYKCILEAAEPDIRGWAVDRNLPGKIFPVEILVDGVLYFTSDNGGRRSDLKAAGKSTGIGGFHIESPLKYLEAGEHEVRLRMPDGSLSNPQKGISPGRRQRRSAGNSRVRNRISIIIPFYNAPAQLQRCLASVARHTHGEWRAIVIDDCSTHPGMKEVLGKYENDPRFMFLRNDKNLGFPGTINIGIAAAGQDDVVLLNSDTRVTPEWLEGLLRGAQSQPKVATVTAMSDRAGAFSAPEMGFSNPLPEGMDEIEYARAFRRQSRGLYPQAPSGNGFCMYINRQTLNECGLLDCDLFRKGYGEENDFCMRVLRQGWKHLIDDCTYIYHEHAISFGSETRAKRVKNALQLINARYPEYRQETGFFANDTRMRVARYCARVAREKLQKAAA